jgi:hypothetical protein
MKFCPTCKTQYPEDANFCPLETCATAEGPQRLQTVATQTSARFQPMDRIGGGRTGDVWRARDTQSGAEVAYKVVAADVVSTPAIHARVEREFKQLMRVASPKIATILECEKLPAGALGVAMELCAGDPLEKLLAAGPMPFEQAKTIVAQVGLALLEAQKVGLVHRDVAPKNILVSSTGEVKVINFPLAKPINDRVAGVADYLSPEQVQGKPVDQRSNTYSLAATLYHMLTGEPPFVGPNVQAVLDMHVSTPVLPPTQRRPGLSLPADTDKLLLKALDKSSSRRHLTLRLFLNELDALKDKPAGIPKPSEAGLAKTMMFGGNQADIARMVAEARAAKAAATGVTPPVTTTAPTHAPAPPVAQPVAPVAHPAPAQSPGVPAAMGPTIAVGMVASPAQPVPARAVAAAPGGAQAHPAAPVVAQAPTPGPIAPPAAQPAPQAPAVFPHQQPQPAAPPAQAARPAQAPAGPSVNLKPHEAGKAPPPKAGAAFRETLWFKQGDVEQLVADAKAKMQAAGKGTGEAAVLPEDSRPLEDRYADDGSVTVEDRKKFSLRTGGTATALPSVGAEVPGEKMDESEMVGEISTGRRTLILVIAAVVILALVVVIAMMVKGKSTGSATGSSSTPAGELAAGHAPAAPPGGQAPPAPRAYDAGALAGPPGAAGSPPSKTRAVGLGAAGGTAGVGGATSGAKPAMARKAAAKRKATAKRPAKHRR